MNEVLDNRTSLAMLAFNYERDMPEGTDRRDLDGAIEQLHKALTPTRYRDRKEINRELKALSQELGAIHLRMRPGDGEQTSKTWATVMVGDLSDLPVKVAYLAVKDARKDPVEYPAQVLGVVLKHANGHRKRYEAAIRILKRWKREFDQPKQKQIAKTDPEPVDLTQMDEGLRNIGLSAGWLIEDETQPSGIRWSTDEEMRRHQSDLESSRARTGKVRNG